MLKLNTCALGVMSLVATISVSHASLTIRTSNIVDFDSTTSAFVDNTGSAIGNGTGFVGVGSFGSLTDFDIQGLTTATDINAAFDIAASTNMNSGIDGLWDASLNNDGDPSGFAGEPIFTLVGNGSSILDSDQFFIYRHSDLNGATGTFVESPGANDPAVVAVGDASTGSIVVGGHDNFDYNFGAGDVAAFNLVSVPEPSSTALLGLGGVAFLLRRRR